LPDSDVESSSSSDDEEEGSSSSEDEIEELKDNNNHPNYDKEGLFQYSEHHLKNALNPNSLSDSKEHKR
jgi:hypothetical protein